MISAMSDSVNLAAGDPALWTLGVTAYAAAILVCTGVAVNAAARGRRRAAIVMAVTVVLLSLAGVVVAVPIVVSA